MLYLQLPRQNKNFINPVFSISCKFDESRYCPEMGLNSRISRQLDGASVMPLAESSLEIEFTPPRFRFSC